MKTLRSLILLSAIPAASIAFAEPTDSPDVQATAESTQLQQTATDAGNLLAEASPQVVMVEATAESLVDTDAATVPTTNANLVAVPNRAIVLTDGPKGMQEQVYTVLYDSNEETTFHDPVPPRFLLIDREGRTVFGIGGYVEGVVSYDFDGAIDNDGFNVRQINVPTDPAFRNQFRASINHTNLYMVLATHTRYGVLSAYAQANFSGEGRDFVLKHAYVRLHNVLGGLTRTLFQDPMSVTPTIDYAGPTGAVDLRNIQVRYNVDVTPNITLAISAEAPQTSYTDGTRCEVISQRVPDIPAFVQYRWDGGKSHIRVSGLLRNLSYRNLVDQENKFATGWAAQISGAVRATKYASVHFATTYGQGYSNYIHATSGIPNGFDLIPDNGGGMKMPRSFNVVGGVRVDFTPKFFMSAAYSFNRIYDQGTLGPDTYRRSNYAVVNAFYAPVKDLLFGVEYLNGSRTNMDHESSSANRIEAMVRYDF